MTILVSGGTGYIGSHTCVELIKNGYDVVVFDNLSNSSEDSLDSVEKITGIRPVFYQADMLDRAAVAEIFSQNKIDAVIHFAGLKAVGESVQKPLEYYHNNITGTLNLLFEMKNAGCKSIVFSSSATVYGLPKALPIKEDFPLHTTNPYGSTKLYLEGILKDLCVSDPEWNVTLLRYFNPVGSHESGLIGENPKGIPNNLMPRLIQAAQGKLEYLTVFGNDYDTKDGTGVRDYIHVSDLAKGHIKALGNMNGIHIYNLGTGHGYSVLEMIKTFEQVNGVTVPYKIVDRRAGDIAACYADASLAKNEIGFEASLGLKEMCKSAWNFASKNN